MIAFLHQLPHLEAYGNPQYFLYLIVAVLPIFIGLFFKKRFPVYEALVSLAFIILMLTGKNLYQILSLLAYVVWQIFLVFSYKIYRKNYNNKWVFYLWVFLAVFPLAWTKITPLMTIDNHQSLFGFLGISYLTFRAVGTIIGGWVTACAKAPSLVISSRPSLSLSRRPTGYRRAGISLTSSMTVLRPSSSLAVVT